MERNINISDLIETLNTIDRFQEKAIIVNPVSDPITMLNTEAINLASACNRFKIGVDGHAEVFGKAASLITSILYYMSRTGIPFDNLIKLMKYLATFGEVSTQKMIEGLSDKEAIAYTLEHVKAPDLSDIIGG